MTPKKMKPPADIGNPISPAPAMEAEPVAGVPERIWVDPDNLTWVEANPDEVMRRDEVCYIRADIAHPQDAESLRGEVEVERDDAMALVAERDAALAAIEKLNKTAADENGHRWDRSDLIAQEILAVRGAFGKPALTPQPDAHPDDLAVDRFAAAMKAKLAKKRQDGRGGWEGPGCTAAILSRLLREHVEKGDPLDVGNLAMMLHQRGEGIEDTPQPDAGLDPLDTFSDAELEAELRGLWSISGSNLSYGEFWARVRSALRARPVGEVTVEVHKAIGSFPVVTDAHRIWSGLMREQIDPLQGYVTKEDCLLYAARIRAAMERG